MALPTRFPKLRGDPTLSRAQDAIDPIVRGQGQALSQTPLMGAMPVWTAPSLPAAFTASMSSPPGYYVDSLSRVQTKGSASTAAGVGANATLMTFPAGLRPGETQRLPVRGNGGTYQSVTVAPTGVVTVDVAIAAGGTVDFGFSFLAER